jgi:hypothetical protein
MAASLDLSAIALVDNHCHSLLADQGPYDLPTWRAFWSESNDPAMARDHVQSMPYYLWAMNQLAEEFDCEPTEAAVLEHHNTHPGDGLSARLLRKSHFEALMQDDGIPGQERGISRERVAELGRCNVGWIVRLEVFQQRLMPEARDFDDFVGRYRQEVAGFRAKGVHGAKSIAAYRGGLLIGPPDEAAAREAFGPLHETARRAGTVRLADKRLLDFTLHLAIEELARQELPLQFHTGYGDTDEDLRLGNPLHLRPLLEERRYWGAPIVLIHEGWPYVRETAYLTMAYAHVFMDLSYEIPYMDYGEMYRFTQAALGTTAGSKILFATDSWGLAEHYFLGAKRGRAILGRVLGELVQDEVLTLTQAEHLAEQILRGTARQLYRLA